MASIKNLKKDVNYVLGDVISKCSVWELENPKANTKKSEKIVNEVIDTFDELTAKIHAKDVENRKTHFKSISAELESKASKLLGKVNNL